MGCQSSTEVKKNPVDQPTEAPKQLSDSRNDQSVNETEDLVKESEAATKIQALYRGFRTRLKLQENNGSESKAAKKKNKQEEKKQEELRADALLKVVLEDKAIASQEAKLRNNSEEEVYRSLRKIIQKSIDQDEPPLEAESTLTDQLSNLATQAKSTNLLEAKEQAQNKLKTGLETASKSVEQALSQIKQSGQSIKETIQEETNRELEKTEQALQTVATTAENQMNQLKEKLEDLDLAKAASDAAENVKEKVTELLPDKIKEMLPESEKKNDSESRPESSKSEASVTSDSSAEKSDKKLLSRDENNNADIKSKKQPEEEEIDIDLADPEVAKVANKLQSAFKFKNKRSAAKSTN